MSAVDEFERVVASEDIINTKTHGHQLLVNSLYAEEKTAIHANSFLHSLKYLYNAILQLIIKRKIISLEKFCGYQLFRENRETFSPPTICNIRYITALFTWSMVIPPLIRFLTPLDCPLCCIFQPLYCIFHTAHLL